MLLPLPPLTGHLPSPILGPVGSAFVFLPEAAILSPHLAQPPSSPAPASSVPSTLLPDSSPSGPAVRPPHSGHQRAHVRPRVRSSLPLPTALRDSQALLPWVPKALHTCPIPSLPSSFSPPRSLYSSHTRLLCSSNTPGRSCPRTLALSAPSAENPLPPDLHTVHALASFRSLLISSASPPPTPRAPC